MRGLIIGVALLAVGCGSSPIAPTIPPPAANVASSGSLTVAGCNSAGGNLFTCFGFSGGATNSGPGCAANVRGVTTTFDAATRVQTGTSSWSYLQMVRPNEQIVYSGAQLNVMGPLTGGWYYTTSITWDSVKCP